MKQPFISIVMVNYNHEDFIGAAIESVLAQTYQNWDLIIVDDGSTDASPSVIAGYAAKDRRIRFYPQEKNRQICVVTNIGLSYVTGEYVARLDSDDIWEPEKLKRQVDYMESHPQGALCFTKLDIINEQGTVVNEKLADFYQAYNRRQKNRAEWLHYFFFFGNTLIQSTLLMKREVLDTVGNFNLAYVQAHDFDFFVRSAKQYDFLFLEEPLVKYRRIEQQNSAWNEKNNRRFFNEHMLIREHFFDDMPDELFQEAFGEHFVNKDSRTHEEFLCEQAFLLCKCVGGEENTPVLGLRRLEQLMREPKMAKLLENTFHYTPKDYYQQTLRRLFITDDLSAELEYLRRLTPMQKERIDMMELIIGNLEGSVAALQEENKKQQKKIEEYENRIYVQQEEIAAKEKIVHDMENSKSWKMTKPLRSIKKH